MVLRGRQEAPGRGTPSAAEVIRQRRNAFDCICKISVVSALTAFFLHLSDHPEDDEEIGGFMFDFLFAAQDASTSSLCWAVSTLDSHPEVLARVRAEVSAAWSPDSGKPMTAETIQGMRYTQAAALDASPPLLRVLPHRRPCMREVRRPWIREGRGRGMRGRRDEQRGGERKGAEEQSASGGAARGGDD
ncbi:unnamed protein product [Miscanthus lutarioriparius]|uniref:C-22 sterol desaturase n=1 Tax=Miscanthus lutarioriparius TaxID=422564 RepID=A0A811RW14_9POAL|nr:unnamed protein product [Miscanthus lutarioriparius]